MSISTKRGDTGETDLLFGRRIAKNHPRIQALGAVDELSAALGLLRVTAKRSETREIAAQTQQWLIAAMGELATSAGDEDRCTASHPEKIDAAKVGFLDGWVSRLEKEEGLRFEGWALPGAAGVLSGAHADFARAVCRRAERCVVDLESTGNKILNPETVRFLNRLSDVLWLIARWEEQSDDENREGKGR